MRHSWIAIWLGLAACGGCDGGSGSGVDSGVADASAAVDAPPTDCTRTPAADDRARFVVVSHPYGEGGAQATSYAVLALSAAGELSDTGATFDMGRATDGVISFTPDGEVGLLAQGDGTLGVFTLDAQGVPTVVHAGYDADDAFYATDVVMDPDGAHAYVVNDQWRENGGGIYRVAIACDGSLTHEGLVAAAKLPGAFIPLGGTMALAAGVDFLDSTAGDTAFAVDLSGPSVFGSTNAFGDDQASVASAAVSASGRYFLIGDNNAFYDPPGMDNRVAVVAVGDVSLAPVQVLTPLEDPYAIIASPFDDGALVVSGFGDAIFELDYDDQNAAAPFSIAGELTYVGGRPQVPGNAVMVDRGSLRGLVLVAEVGGVRRARFNGGGAIEDLGVTPAGTGVPGIVGAIGIQP
jgi:hypothetical protein